MPTPQCAGCRHFAGRGQDGIRCAAFPKHIPDAILEGEHDHRLPYKGDHGIRFEPLPPPG